MNKTERIAATPRAPGGGASAALILYHQMGTDVVTLGIGETVVIGRDLLPEPIVSRRHCEVSFDGQRARVRDLGSTNGTRVGGCDIGEDFVDAGDEIQLGNAVVAVHILPHGAPRPESLHGHTWLLGELRAQMKRVDKVALLFIEGARVSAFAADVRQHLRDIDATALYAKNILEVLLPGFSVDDAGALARRIATARSDVSIGVAGYPRPATSEDELVDRAHQALRQARASGGGVCVFAHEARIGSSNSGPVVRSPKMAALYDDVTKLAQGSISVLVLGETGTGKEVVARELHTRGPRKSRELVAVNCGGLSEQLVESQLFGHEKGAFTGADKQHIGFFESAKGGTLFLDEIGELPLALQPKLLRALNDKKIRRIGGTHEIDVDVRFVCATHRDLRAMVQEGTFRQDLLFRINNIELQVPPLRERPDEIVDLAMHFLQQTGTRVRSLDDAAARALCVHRWPGNVRELKNAMERAPYYASGPVLTLTDLPETVRGGGAIPSRPVAPDEKTGSSPVFDPAATLSDDKGTIDDEMRRVRRKKLLEALDRNNHVLKITADDLRMPVRTLSYQLSQLGLRRVNGRYVDQSGES